jgi:lipopolysaccharide biosynthesis glycosyltransferase
MVKYKYNLHFEISAVELQQIHQHFMASLVILVFAEPPHSFLSLNRLSTF